MRDFIQRMYHAIQEGNVELFDDIEEDIKKRKYRIIIRRHSPTV